MGVPAVELTREWAVIGARALLVVTYCNHRHENFAVALIPACGTLYALALFRKSRSILQYSPFYTFIDENEVKR
jgi:hypothetical protein